MKLYFKNQSKKLKSHLENLKSRPIMKYEKSKLIEKITQIALETDKQLTELNLDFLFDYKIFPENILIFKTEWNNENREMKVGDTIVQQAFLPPAINFSQKVIFGVRVKEIINEENKRGFSYETIKGHVEKGISTFTIEKNSDKLIVKIHTFSEPGNLLTKIVGSIITIPYQKYCTKKALESVKQQIEIQ